MNEHANSRHEKGHRGAAPRVRGDGRPRRDAERLAKATNPPEKIINGRDRCAKLAFRRAHGAEVTNRLQLESHFSFHEYDGDGRIVRHYAQVARQTVKTLAMPEVRMKFDELGLDPIGNTPAEFAAAIRKETPEWAKVIKDAGVKLGN